MQKPRYPEGLERRTPIELPAESVRAAVAVVVQDVQVTDSPAELRHNMATATKGLFEAQIQG